jgi:hypothetical protein
MEIKVFFMSGSSLIHVFDGVQPLVSVDFE